LKSTLKFIAWVKPHTKKYFEKIGWRFGIANATKQLESADLLLCCWLPYFCECLRSCARYSIGWLGFALKVVEIMWF
jgi:hypothetical protein